MRAVIWFITFFTPLFSFHQSHAQGFGVFPISQTINVQAGRVASLEFNLLNFGPEEIGLDVSHEYAIAISDEASIAALQNARLRPLLAERPGDQGPWFDIEDTITLSANTDGGSALVKIPVTLPSEASGTYSGSIVFTQQSEGLLQLSYRCNYTLVVQNRPLIKDVLLTDVEVIQLDTGTEFRAGVRNIGNSIFELAGDYSILRKVANRARPVLQGSIEPITIAPSRSTQIRESLNEVLATGSYEVRVMPKFDGKNQRPKVFGFDHLGPSDAGVYLADGRAFLGPILTNIPLAAKSRRSQFFSVENLTNEPFTIDLALQAESVEGVEASIQPATLSVNAGATARFRLQAVADDALQLKAPTPLMINASITGPNDNLVEQDIAVWLVETKSETDQALEMSDLTLTADPDTGDFRIQGNLTNLSSLPITPLGTLVAFTQVQAPYWSKTLALDVLGQGKTVKINETLNDMDKQALDLLKEAAAAGRLQIGFDVAYPAVSSDSLFRVDLPATRLE